MLCTIDDHIYYFGLGVYIYYQVVWILLNLPYLLIEKYRWQWALKHKIQPKVRNDYSKMYAIFMSEVKSQLCIFMPLSVLASHLLRSYQSFESPTFKTICAQLLLAILTHNATFMIIHRLLHTPYLYRTVHKVHHEYYAPHSLSAEHAHPIESIFGFFLPLLVAMLSIVKVYGQVTLQFEMIYMFYVSYASVQGHSGYSFPWNFEHIPVLSWLDGGATHHDLHHKLVKCNYGPKYLDYIFGSLRVE